MSRLMQVAGGVTSITLIAGLGLWGYRLAVRDVSGVPVVRALQGPMRVQPEYPGGQLADHQGLAVNRIQAEGDAAPAPDRLVLAPQPVEVIAADPPGTSPRPMPRAVARAESPTDTAATNTGANVNAEPDTDSAVAAAIAPAARTTAGAAPKNENGAAEADDARLEAQITAPPLLDPAAQLSPVAAVVATPEPAPAPASAPARATQAPVAATAAAIAAPAAAPEIIAASVPGVVHSPRPLKRPATLAARAAAPDKTSQAGENGPGTLAASAAPRETGAIDPATLPPGTRLVQLGAFDSADLARREWSRLTKRFPDYFEGKSRVIQEASSGGRTFFRLRAQGFDAMSDARRFCSALLAERAACIPVVLR